MSIPTAAPAAPPAAPAPTATRAGRSAAHLPVQLTTFVGREREVATLRALLAGTRLLTLTGAGGSGKTRLALELAAREAASGPVVWVELAPVGEAGLLAQHVAAAFGIREEGKRPVSEALVAELADRPVLVVLDNCEHVVDACAAFAESLLRACPGVRVLATSREALGVGGERAWLTPALSLPPEDAGVDAALEAEAVRLFRERARDASPDFDVHAGNAGAVAEICRRLDGIPLAIELAAARVRVLPPEQIRQRLDDRFRLLTTGGRTAIPRHRTLRAVIDWSYDLLSAEEQALLQRLSVFAGSFSIEAAEAVCAGGDLHPDDVLDLISRLVDRSLLGMQEQHGRARYALLETVRQYAAERLEPADQTASVHARHADHFRALAAEAEPHLTTAAGRRPWVARLHEDVENLRHALAWTREHRPEHYPAFAASLAWFWFSTRYWSEGRRSMEDALALPTARAGGVRAAVLFGAGMLASLQGEVARAQPWLEESAEIAAAAGDRRQQAYALNYLGMVMSQQGLPECAEPLKTSLALFRELDDPYGLRLCMLLLGMGAMAAGDLERAEALAGEGVRIARTFGQDRELAVSLQTLGVIVLRRGDLPRAEALLRESLEALRRDPFYLFIAQGLELLAAVIAARGDAAEAVRRFAAADRLREILGAAPFKILRDLWGPRQDEARAALGRVSFEAHWAAGRAMPLAESLDEALAVPAPGAADAHPAAPPAVAVPRIVTGSASAAPAALRVAALGPLRIERDGEPLPADAWSYGRPRELLLYLLLHPAGRTRDQIGAEFWPEASSAQVKNSFHVTVHHLRRTLGGADWVVFENDRYSLNRGQGCELDVEVFEARLTAALRAEAAGAGSEAALRDALALYRGDFLYGEGVGDWHLDVRDHLRRRQLDGLLALGRLLMGESRWSDAADVYQHVVIREDLHEEAHRCLMTCRARSGDRAGALRQFERLRDLLRDELDAEPAAETLDLYDRLRQAAPI
jgi:predicted ATPase/DNA-binding SARP family transcriptional activator